jgi:predicted lipoprotein with Yx(FWY)xxD motif
MIRTRAITFLAGGATIPLLALAVAACGGSGAATAASPAPAAKSTASSTTSTKGTMVRVATSNLGSILVNAAGRTLYLFKADSGTTSTCTAACATAWPPLRTTGNPIASGGASATLLGTTPRSDGAAQVTYNGHPLYYYIGDKKPGDVTGQGLVAFGAAWYVVSPSGKQITGKSTSVPAGNAGGSVPAGNAGGY